MLAILKRRNVSQVAAANSQAATDSEEAIDSEAAATKSQVPTETIDDEKVKQTNEIADNNDQQENYKTEDEDNPIIKEEPKSPTGGDEEDHDFLNSELRIVLPNDDIKQEAMDTNSFNMETPYES